MKKTRPIELSEKLIPEGQYCYSYPNGSYTSCPYLTHIEIIDGMGPGIIIPYCLFEKASSLPNNLEIEEFERLKKYFDFKSDDEIWDSVLFELDLLWDQVKECGINYGDERDNN